jgi:hypothetical protein
VPKPLPGRRVTAAKTACDCAAARYTERVEERRLRIGSVFEWIVAAFAVVLLIWVISVPVQRALGPGVEAALVEAPIALPPGVPVGATTVPVILLLDGREIRQGDLMSNVDAILPARLAEGPPLLSTSELGDRRTRSYLVDGTRFYVVCERLEPGGPMRVSGIYLP